LGTARRKLDSTIGRHLHSENRRISIFRRWGLNLLRDGRKSIIRSHGGSRESGISADAVGSILAEAAAISERHRVHGRELRRSRKGLLGLAGEHGCEISLSVGIRSMPLLSRYVSRW
jgi:hypothetical protein